MFITCFHVFIYLFDAGSTTKFAGSSMLRRPEQSVGGTTLGVTPVSYFIAVFVICELCWYTPRKKMHM
jgi:hypothetical protein